LAIGLIIGMIALAAGVAATRHGSATPPAPAGQWANAPTQMADMDVCAAVTGDDGEFGGGLFQRRTAPPMSHIEQSVCGLVLARGPPARSA
jgi:hypothetical protein